MSENLTENAARHRMSEYRTTIYSDIRAHLPFVLMLLLAAGAVYGSISGHEFLTNWDDSRYVLENADIRGFEPERLKAIFTRYYVGNYAPVQMLSYMVDYTLWGLWPGGYLLVNLLLHAANALLLYHLFLRLIGNRMAAFIGAAFFLLHPVQVESVAWISQRKNLLAMFFFLFAWEFYRAYREASGRSRWGCYAASLVALLLALLSKSVTVIFPAVMVLFDHCYPPVDGRSRYLDKVPYLLVAATAAVVALMSQTPDYTEWGAGGGRAVYHGGSIMATFLTMLPVYCSYLRLIVWPTNLSALYDPVIHTTLDAGVLTALLLLGGVLFLVYRLYRYDRRMAFWPLVAMAALLPVSQIVPLVTLMNDRYLYFPLIGVAALTGYAANGLVKRPAIVVSLLILLLLASLSSQRARVWRNSYTLWSDAVRKSPGNASVWGLYGEACHFDREPRYGEAARAYLHSLELEPGRDMTRYNLGALYAELNDLDASESVFRELLRRSPDNVMGWSAYGELAFRRGDYSEAEMRFRKALVFQPEAVPVLRKLGNLMVVLGRLSEAGEYYGKIEMFQGKSDPQAAYDLARIESISGNLSGSLVWLDTALRRGYGDYAGIMADEELAVIRSDARFTELMTRYFRVK